MAVEELPYEVQQFDSKRRAEYNESNGWFAVHYLTPNFLTYFPVVMEPAGGLENIQWNKIGGLFRQWSSIPATLIDEKILVQLVQLRVFKKDEYAERHSLALFWIVVEEEVLYALTVVYVPSWQAQLSMYEALTALVSTKGSTVALAHMPKNYKECAYMQELSSGEHFTLVPVSGNTGAAFGPVGAFAAAVLTAGSTHVQVGTRVKVKLPGSFTRNHTENILIDEEVYVRFPVWQNKDLVEVEEDGETKIIRNDCMIAVKHEISIVKADVYTAADATPLTLVACKPIFHDDSSKFTESLSEMCEHLEYDIEAVCKAEWANRIQQWASEQTGIDAVTMDTIPAPPDPSAIPGTDLYVLLLPGVTMMDFSQLGRVGAPGDLTGPPPAHANLTSMAGEQATATEGASPDLVAEANMFKCLDTMSKDLAILEDRYFKCLDATTQVVKEFSAKMDALDDAYMVAIRAVMGKSCIVPMPKSGTPSTPPWTRPLSCFIMNV